MRDKMPKKKKSKRDSLFDDEEDGPWDPEGDEEDKVYEDYY
jgi:hypothetical protein